MRIDHRAPCLCVVELATEDAPERVAVGENCRALEDPPCSKQLAGGGWCLRPPNHEGDCEGIRNPASPPAVAPTARQAGLPGRSPKP